MLYNIFLLTLCLVFDIITFVPRILSSRDKRQHKPVEAAARTSGKYVLKNDIV